MTPDRELLRQYAEQGDEAAFAEVVRRQVDWVHSTARRLVAGDAQLAEDITQGVFTDLARKAGKISHYEAPGGWLHTATRFAAAKAVDREQRRRQREQAAFAMQPETTTPEIHWEQLRPVLDEAIGGLSESDRNAVVWRFFEGKSHGEIGELVGLSEDSARKRVERAVEKLRANFSRRGLAVSSVLLAEAVSANAVSAAPTAFADGLAGSVLAQAATFPLGLAALAKTFITMTTTTKIILGTVALVIAVASYRYLGIGPDAAPANAPVVTNATRLPVAATLTPPVPPPSAAAATAALASAQVVPPKLAAASVGGSSPAPAPIAPPADNALDAPQTETNARVAAKMQDVMVMMQLGKKITTVLAQTNDANLALQQIQLLMPQVKDLKTKIKGTPSETILTKALGQFTDTETALEQATSRKRKRS